MIVKDKTLTVRRLGKGFYQLRDCNKYIQIGNKMEGVAMVKTEYTKRDFSKKKTDLPLKCKMIAGTGSVLDQWRVTGEAKLMGNASVVTYNNPRVHYQGSHSLRSTALP